MKIYYNNQYIKSVPNRYEPIKESIPDLLLFEDKRRLSKNERVILDRALMKHHFQTLIKKYKSTNRSVFNYLKDSVPEKILLVTRRDDSTEYQILFSDNKRLRCSKSDFPDIPFFNTFQW